MYTAHIVNTTTYEIEELTFSDGFAAIAFVQEQIIKRNCTQNNYAGLVYSPEQQYVVHIPYSGDIFLTKEQ